MSALDEIRSRFQNDRFATEVTGIVIAANGYSGRETVTVSQNVSITYLAPAKGTRLIAEAWCLRSGKTTALYAVDVRDELDTYVAHAAVNGYVISHNKS